MPVKLHYGVPTHRSGVNVRFGIEKGFFAEEGMDVVVREIFGGPEISAAYDSGELKIGELGTPPGITAIGRGQRFRIIGSGLPRGVGLFFIVRTDMRNWEDLRGRPLGALSIGSCSYWYLRQMLIQNGLDPDRDVDVKGLGDDYARQLELLASGEIVALLSTEPNCTIGEAQGIVRIWGNVLSLADVPQLQWVIQVANEDFLRDEPKLVRTFLRVAQRSSRYLGDHQAEWVAFNARIFEMSPEIAARSVARERATLHFDGQLDLPGLECAIALQHQLGAIDSHLPVERFVAEGFQPLPTIEDAADAPSHDRRADYAVG
jgi:ABC-type nitrate/sulfonate/bicarbonate transport system substrate-binding protein